MPDLDYWDPPSHERDYYRHQVKGDLGWLVRREGRDCIKYDRPDQEIVIPYNEHDWIREQEYRPFSDAQIVQVAFAADKALCMLLGMHDKSRKEWVGLSDHQRAKWMREGPRNNRHRAKMYRAIRTALEDLGK
jgi:hypothetical protein